MASEYDSNQQFAQVLNRLDALMKRGHAGEAPVPPPLNLPEAEAEFIPHPVEQAAEEASADHSTPFVIIEEPDAIPVLTEVFDGTPPGDTADEGSLLAEAVIDALMPLMLENLDIIVAEEAARMQQNIAERLRAEIALTLRERLPTSR